LFLTWVCVSTAAGAAAWLFGGDLRLVGEATALAIAPGLAGLILLPWLARPGAALALLGAWVLSATG